MCCPFNKNREFQKLLNLRNMGVAQATFYLQVAGVEMTTGSSGQTSLCGAQTNMGSLDKTLVKNSSQFQGRAFSKESKQSRKYLAAILTQSF
jgi:hypothetical protein